MSDIDDTRYGYIHESAFLEGVERGKEDSAETISALRAEVERKAKVLVMYETLTDAQSAELTQLREDRRVLGVEVNKWRSVPREHFNKVWDQPQMSGLHRSEYRQALADAIESTDASGALERANG